MLASSLVLNYSSLLKLTDIEAFQQAMNAFMGSNFQDLLDQLDVTLGSLTVPDSDDPTLTQVGLISPSSDQPQPEYIQYQRLDIGAYMECCQKHFTNGDLAIGLDHWFLTTHGLYFDPTHLQVSAPVAAPNDNTKQIVTVTVAPGNFIWMGSVDLYLVPSNHLALFAVPGTATGIRTSDVGIPVNA